MVAGVGDRSRRERRFCRREEKDIGEGQVGKVFVWDDMPVMAMGNLSFFRGGEHIHAAFGKTTTWLDRTVAHPE